MAEGDNIDPLGREFLSIGDEFALQSIPNEQATVGFVSTKKIGGKIFANFLDGSDINTTHPPRPLLSRFTLMTAQQYGASKEYQKWQARTRDKDPEEGEKLREQADAEAEVNASEYALSTGINATFGGVYQLLSTSADQFLEIQKTTSEEDSTALRAALADRATRSKMAWFRIQPGFRTRNEGEKVRMGDTVVLESVKMQSMYLHCNMQADMTREVAEVNFFDQATRFKVVPISKFSEVQQVKRSQGVCAGSFVEIYRRQSSGYVYRNHMTNRGCLLKVDAVADAADAVPIPKLQADLLWQLNLPNMTWNGEPVMHDRSYSQRFSLRDAISGYFLFDDGSGEIVFREEDSDPGALWVLIPFEMEGDDSELLEVERSQFWFQNTSTGRQLCELSDNAGADGKPADLTQLTSRDPLMVAEADLFVLREVPADFENSFFELMQGLSVLRAFHEDIKELPADPSKQDVKPVVEKHFKQYMKSDRTLALPWSGPVIDVIEHILINLTSSSNTDMLTRDGVLNTRLQAELTQSRALDFILEQLLPDLFAKLPPKVINTETHGPYLAQTVKLLFRLMWGIAKENKPSKFWLFDRMDYLMSFIDDGFNVANVINAIFNGNEQLMRKTDTEFIKKMWTKAIEQKATRYLKFVTVILAVNNKSLKFNQDRVSELVRSTARPSLFKVDLQNATILQRDDPDVEFHVMLVTMARMLCAGRHRDSVDFFLQAGFSYRMVLQRMTDQSNIYSVRLAYTHLMQNLFVDREPYEIHAIVQTNRMIPSIAEEATDSVTARLGVPPAKYVDPYSDLKGDIKRPTKGFADLKEAIFSELGNLSKIKADEQDKNEYMASMINLSHVMLTFGLYDACFDTEKHDDGVLLLGLECIKLGEKLLMVMDGTADDMCSLEDDGDLPARFRTDLTETATIMRLKTAALDLVADLFGLRASTKVRVLVKAVQSVKGLPLGTSASADSAATFEAASSPSAGADSAATFEVEDNFSNPLAMSNGKMGDISTGPVKGKEAASLEAATQPNAEILKAATEAMEEADAVRVFNDPAAGDNLVNCLLDGLRYNENLSLCLKSFATLVMFAGRNVVFCQTIKKIKILGTDEHAKIFLIAMEQVSEFRRLRKWLHIEKQCDRCIEVCGILGNWCSTTFGQDMLRDLNIEEYIVRVLSIRMPSTSFKNLIRSTLILVAQFCQDNPINQNLMAGHLQTLFMNLLWDIQYYESTVQCMTAIVHSNEPLSVGYSGALTSICGKLASSPEHGRRLVLLKLLEQLLIVEDHPIEPSQLQVCKGAMISRNLIETAGDIERDEWGSGPAMNRNELMIGYIKDPDSDQGRRCKAALEYYSYCMVVLGICARGKMPTTELLCASLISFDDCVGRIYALINDPQLQEPDPWHKQPGDNECGMLMRVKLSLLTFFREVFVDTNSENILMSLRRARNNVWVLDEDEELDGNKVSLAQSMYNDMKMLFEYEQDQVKQRLTYMQQGKDVSQLSARRTYLFEECVMFFIQYGRVVGPSTAAVEDADAITSMYSAVYTLGMQVKNSDDWTTREHVLLDQMCSVCADWSHGVDPPISTALQDQELSMASQAPDNTPPLSQNEQNWQQFSAACMSTVPVAKVKGTDRLVGIGIMKLASLIWRQSYDDVNGEQVPMGNYVNFLIKPLFEKLNEIKETQAADEIPPMMTVFDTVRSVLFVASAYTNEKLEDAFRRFCSVVELNGGANPDVAAVQTTMIQEGWGLLCFDVLSAPQLSKLHLPCLRLLLALTGGASTDVKDALLSQICGGESGCGTKIVRELFATACRKCLRNAVMDIKLARKNTDPNATLPETGFASETLAIMSNVVSGHDGMKDYFMQQMGHDEKIDLVVDTVAYMNALERDVKAACIKTPGLALVAGGPVDKAVSCCVLLRNMASGPHKANQNFVAHSEIPPIINRILAYSDYNSVEDVDIDSDTCNRPKGRINMAMVRMLLALLEGAPDAEVVSRLLTAIEWPLVAKHMKTMALLIEEGVVLGPTSKNVKTPKKKNGAKALEAGPMPIAVPAYISDPKAKTVVEWLQRESFQFFSVIEKLRLAGKSLEDNPKYGDSVLDPLMPVLTDLATMKFFSERVGQCQVIRDGELEYLFFPMPMFRDPREVERIESTMIRVMEQAPRDDGVQKLQAMLEGMNEITANIKSNDVVADVAGSRVPAFYDFCNRKQPTMYFSFVICGMLSVSFNDQASGDNALNMPGWSLDAETFSREPIIAEYFGFFSVLHLLISVYRFFCWTQIRFPVLQGMYKRAARLAYLREPHQDVPGVRDDIIERSIVARGLPHEIKGYEISEASVKNSFQRFGAVSSTRVACVPPGDDVDTDQLVSWALITFNFPNAVKKALAKQEAEDGLIRMKRFQKGARIPVTVRAIDNDYVNSSPTLAAMIDSSTQELLIIRSDTLFALAEDLQEKLNLTPFGKYIPVTTIYTFKSDPELLDAMADIGMSIMGGLVHPLCYTFHLFKMLKLDGAVIVVTSMTQNVDRLSLTIAICLLFAWVFSISGLLYFKEYHDETKTNNEGGPCANLMTCFFSYSYVSLMASGVGAWVPSNTFPVNVTDVMTKDFAAELWEILFAMVAMFVVSIITGIICDTFGELRGNQDEAKNYRLTTNFVTNIPFATIPEEKSTHYLQYANLMLHLARRRESQITPLEKMVRDKCLDGDISWMPDERCIALEADGDGDDIVEELTTVKQRLASIEKLLTGLAKDEDTASTSDL